MLCGISCVIQFASFGVIKVDTKRSQEPVSKIHAKIEEVVSSCIQ